MMKSRSNDAKESNNAGRSLGSVAQDRVERVRSKDGDECDDALLRREASVQSRGARQCHSAAGGRHADTHAIHANRHPIGDHVQQALAIRIDHNEAAHRKTGVEESESMGGLHQMLSAHQTDKSRGASRASGSATGRHV